MGEAHDLGALAGRRAEHSRIESSWIVPGIEGLDWFAGGHGHPRIVQICEEPGGYPRLADLGACSDHDNEALRPPAFQCI
jgi:hypothetical protein